MTRTTLHSSDSPTSATSSAGLGAAAAVFAGAYFVAMFLPSLPEGAYSDARVTALLSDPGSRLKLVLAGYALALAGLALLAFVACLVRRLGEHRPLLALPAAAACAGLLMTAAALFTSIPMGVALGELKSDADPTLFRVLSNAGFHVLLVGGLLLGSAVVASLSVAMRRNPAVPAWLPKVGFAVAFLLLLGFAWVPQFLLPLWTICVAIGLRGRD